MKKILYAMFGGAPDSFAGPVHRVAAQMDGHFELKAGIFSSDIQRSRAIAQELGIEAERAYSSVDECMEKEAKLDDGIEMVSIVTPNMHHFSMATAAISAGMHVMCEKPLTRTLAEAEELAKLLRNKGQDRKVFALSHVYSAYPMIHFARSLVQEGKLGTIRFVNAQCPQGSLSRLVETSSKHASWRTDPKQSGAGTVADIGTHAYHLINFVCGLRTQELCAELSTFVEGRQTDDNAQVMLRYANGTRGMIWVSQIATGYENPFILQVIGTDASLEWNQEDPNYITLYPLDGVPLRYTRNSPAYIEHYKNIADKSMYPKSFVRVAKGHPEGYLEAFANLYCLTAEVIHNADSTLQQQEDGFPALLPGIDDGLAGMRFVETCLRSSNNGGSWVSL